MAIKRAEYAISAAGLTALALAFAPLATASPDTAGCPAGQVVDSYTGQCVLDIAPISWHDGPEGYTVHIGPSYGSGGVPSVNGIPCTPEHIGTCIGMSQNAVPHTQPHSTISHSP